MAHIAQFLRTRPSLPAFAPASPALIGHNGGPPLSPPTIQLLAPRGQPIGTNTSRRGTEIYTIDRPRFDNLIWNLTTGSLSIVPPQGYQRRYYVLSDRCIFGLRMSNPYGLTIDVPSQPELPLGHFKIHYRGGE